MRGNSVWGTDIDLYYAANCFNCSIFVFSKHGKAYNWLEFKPENKNTNLAIYLDHQNFDHYDVVTSVDKCRNASNLLVWEEKNQHKPLNIDADCYQHEEKDEAQFDVSMVSCHSII